MTGVSDDAVEKGKEEPKDGPVGLFAVFTGDGKGKTTAALGTLSRAMGYGHRAGVIQFIKGKWKTGERLFFEEGDFPDLSFQTMGRGFTWESDDISKDKARARAAWEESKRLLSDEEVRLVVLDELTYPIHYGFITVAEACEAIENRPKTQHVIVTGRRAPQEFVDAADLVTEMTLVKHPFKAGVSAQRGFDF